MDTPTNSQAADRGWKKSFFTIFTGQALSLIGSSAVQFSLIWWLSSETESAMMLALAGLLAFLPQLVLGPFAGVWVDRLKRKTVIICADLFVGLVAAGFAVAFFIRTPPYWSACVVLGVRAVGGVFHTPAIQAAVPMLVPREKLTWANGWSQFLQSGAFMLGPVAGAAMYAALPLPVILLTDLLGALIAVLTVATVKIPELSHEHQARPHFFREIKEGVAIFLKDRKLTIVTASMTLSMIFFMPLGTLHPLMVSNYFRGDAWHASIAQIVYAAGMMGGAVVAGSLGRYKNRLLQVQLSLFLSGVFALMCGILPQTMFGFWLFVLICLLIGATGNLYNIPLMAYLQESIPREAQGRAFSLLGSLMSFSLPLGLAAAGPVSEAYGVTAWFLVAGIAVMAVTALSTGPVFTRK